MIEQSASLIEPSVEQQIVSVNPSKYNSARQKIENYIISQDINLGMMFAIMDTNSNSEISFPEFKQKLRAMHIPLDDEEFQSFFRKLDIDNSQSITFDEMVNEFHSIAVEKCIRNIKKILVEGGVDPDFFFTKHAKMDRTHSKMSHQEFTALLKDIQPKLIRREIYHVIRYFDRGSKGRITKEDFLHAITTEV